MKLLKPYIVCFLFTLIGRTAFSQNDLFNFVDSSLKVLEAQKTGPIIVFNERPTYALKHVDLPGYPNSILQEAYYSFHPLGNDIMITKYINVILGVEDKACCPTKIIKSTPIQIKGDSLFRWFNNNDSLLSMDYILPYIYRDTLDGIVSYRPSSRLHQPVYAIIIFRKSIPPESIPQIFSFEPDEFSEYIFEGIEDNYRNLNYLRNSKTAIFKLYFKLKEMLELYDGSFKFSK
jgi:hypothetical protein